jgi:hypothetical protein
MRFRPQGRSILAGPRKPRPRTPGFFVLSRRTEIDESESAAEGRNAVLTTTSRTSRPSSTSAELSSRMLPSGIASRLGKYALASARCGETKAAYASATRNAISGIPRIASDHRPAARGAHKASTPKPIKKSPRTRFLKALDNAGMGCSPLRLQSVAELIRKPCNRRRDTFDAYQSVTGPFALNAGSALAGASWRANYGRTRGWGENACDLLQKRVISCS